MYYEGQDDILHRTEYRPPGSHFVCVTSFVQETSTSQNDVLIRSRTQAYPRFVRSKNERCILLIIITMKPSIFFLLVLLHISPTGAAFGGHLRQQRQLQVQDCAGSDPITCGCSSVNQADYRGDISVTTGGQYTCQAWDSQSPHSHDRTPENYPDKGLDGGHNYVLQESRQ